jgi:hypothetical protein
LPIRRLPWQTSSEAAFLLRNGRKSSLSLSRPMNLRMARWLDLIFGARPVFSFSGT